MSIEKALEKATIRFPEGINLSEGEDLMAFVAKELPAEIRYTPSQGKSVRPRGKELATTYFSPELTGNITHKARPMTFDSFECPSNSTELTSLKFITIPGYNYEEHRKEARLLWDDVRKVVDKYFNSQYIKKRMHRDRHR